MEQVRWALVGTSDFALEWIGPAIGAGSNSTLAAVVSRDPDRAQRAARRIGAPRHATDVTQLDPAEVDGVFLVTPNGTHERLAVEAARAGLHVIVEKPMAPTVEACHRMTRSAVQSGVTLAVAHCMAWAPPVATANKLIADGAIGRLLWASMSQAFVSPPDGQWRQAATTAEGGGPLYDVGSHAIDALARMLGPVRQVAAFLDHAAYDYPAEDLASMLLLLDESVHATVHTSFATHHNTFEIVGSAGSLRSREWIGRDFAGDLQLLRDGREEAIGLEHRNVYVEQIQHVSAHILHGEPLWIGADAATATVGVLEAAVRAARTSTTTPVAV